MCESLSEGKENVGRDYTLYFPRNTPKQVEMSASGLKKMSQGFSFVLGLCVIFLGAGSGKYSGEFGAGY